MRPWPSLWEYNPSQKVSSGQPIPTHFCINIAHRAWSYSLKGGEIRLRRAYNQEFWCQAYLYISSNPAGWESESTTSTLKVCSSQREKVLLRRGCTVVLEAPRTFAHGGESLPVASTMLRSRGHQHHGWRGHLLDSRSFLWEKKKKQRCSPWQRVHISCAGVLELGVRRGAQEPSVRTRRGAWEAARVHSMCLWSCSKLSSS